ncbi:MAG: hypothetical protein V3T53_04645 [Phycisphaerales bacterium]
MRHKTWFRLVLKAIGVLLIGFAASGVATLFTNVGYLAMYGDPFGVGGGRTTNWIYWQFMSPHVGDLVQLGLGLYLLFGGRWIADVAIPSNRPYCPECGYDIAEATGKCCPECGVQIVSRGTPETNPDPGDPR